MMDGPQRVGPAAAGPPNDRRGIARLGQTTCHMNSVLMLFGLTKAHLYARFDSAICPDKWAFINDQDGSENEY
jgi:hypothetical protein